MRTIAIIEARMTSERLPGKVMLPLGKDGKPALLHVIERAMLADNVDRVVVASPDAPESLPIIEMCKREHVPVWLGSENDVLGRVAGAAREYKADVVVSLTGDCPLTDTRTISNMLHDYINTEVGEDHIFMSNMIEDDWPLGFAVQIFTGDMLATANREAKCREHTGLWMKENYQNIHEPADPMYDHLPRLTLDYPEDYTLLQKVFDLNPVDLVDLSYIFELHPEWKTINAHCVQKVPV